MLRAPNDNFTIGPVPNGPKDGTNIATYNGMCDMCVMAYVAIHTFQDWTYIGTLLFETLDGLSGVSY